MSLNEINDFRIWLSKQLNVDLKINFNITSSVIILDKKIIFRIKDQIIYYKKKKIATLSTYTTQRDKFIKLYDSITKKFIDV